MTKTKTSTPERRSAVTTSPSASLLRVLDRLTVDGTRRFNRLHANTRRALVRHGLVYRDIFSEVKPAVTVGRWEGRWGSDNCAAVGDGGIVEVLHRGEIVGHLAEMQGEYSLTLGEYPSEDHFDLGRRRSRDHAVRAIVPVVQAWAARRVSAGGS